MKKGAWFGILTGVIIIIIIFAFVQDRFWFYISGAFAVVSICFGIAAFAIEKELGQRKKYLRILGYVCLFFLLSGLFLRYLEWPGFSILFMAVICLFCFSWLPVFTQNKIQKWKLYTRKNWHAYLLSTGDLLSLFCIFMGYMFKVFHWPGANLILTLGVTVLAISLLGWNRLFSREIVYRKKAEEEIAIAMEALKHEKKMVEEKSAEIQASINYAQKIQHAILPSTQEMEKGLKAHFVFYRPRDIVSGDFYWYSKVEDSVLWAVADCTGHGVPGGFMSMLGTGLLDQIVNEEKEVRPDNILNRLRERIILALKQTGTIGENKDGMDIALCRYIPSKKIVQFAGANNGLYHIRQKQLQVLAPDKQPVGIYAGDQQSFSVKEFEVKEGDAVYLTSDGYADQFGGQFGKKYKTTNLQKTLLELSDKHPSEQLLALEKNFLAWKGDFEQLDDVCVMGVRF